MATSRRPRDADSDQTLTEARLFDAAPVPMWCSDLGGRMVTINRAGLDLLRAASGRMELTQAAVAGARVRDILPADAAQMFLASDQQVLATGGKVVNRRHITLATGRTFAFDAIKQPLLGSHGQVIGIVGLAQPLTAPGDGAAAPAVPPEPTFSESRLRPATSLLLSLVQITARSDGDPRALLAALARRVEVVCTTLDRAGRTDRVDLRSLLRHLGDLSCRGHAHRIGMAGPDIALHGDRTVPLALTLHELMSNAAQHGALRDDGGQAHATWTRPPRGGIEIRWEEVFATPRQDTTLQEGMGLSFARGLVVDQLGGQFVANLEHHALHARLVIPDDAPSP